MMYEKVLKDYPQLRDNLNCDKEFCFCDPSKEVFELIHEIMKNYWLSVNYNCIDGKDWYFVFDVEERAERYKREEGFISILYSVYTSNDIDIVDTQDFSTYEEAKNYYNNFNSKCGDTIELQIHEWYNNDEITDIITLEKKEGTL